MKNRVCLDEEQGSVLVAVWIQQVHAADAEKMARYQEKMPVAPARWDGLR